MRGPELFKIESESCYVNSKNSFWKFSILWFKRFCTILGTYLSDYAAGSLSDDEVQTQKPNSECKFYYTNYRNATSCSCCTSWYQYLGNLIHYFKSCLMSPDPKLPVTAAAVSKKGTLKVH